MILAHNEDDKVKEGENEVFDGEVSVGFDGVNTARKPRRVRTGPVYRRVHSYFKGTRKYWEERNRRKRALELVEKGLTCRQVAEQLGVSERTVKRDLSKIKPYYQRKIRSYYARLEEERRRQFDAQVEGKSLLERLEILDRLIEEQDRLLKVREYQRHQLVLIIDLDNLSRGYPAVKCWPKLPIAVTHPFDIYLEFVKNGEKKRVGPGLGLVR